MSGRDLHELAKIFGHFEYQDDGALCEAGAATHCQTSNTAREIWTLFERATPKVKSEVTNVRVLYAREIFYTRF